MARDAASTPIFVLALTAKSEVGAVVLESLRAWAISYLHLCKTNLCFPYASSSQPGYRLFLALNLRLVSRSSREKISCYSSRSSTSSWYVFFSLMHSIRDQLKGNALPVRYCKLWSRRFPSADLPRWALPAWAHLCRLVRQSVPSLGKSPSFETRSDSLALNKVAEC